jgi:hypothetical protein
MASRRCHGYFQSANLKAAFRLAAHPRSRKARLTGVAPEFAAQ